MNAAGLQALFWVLLVIQALSAVAWFAAGMWLARALGWQLTDAGREDLLKLAERRRPGRLWSHELTSAPDKPIVPAAARSKRPSRGITS